MQITNCTLLRSLYRPAFTVISTSFAYELFGDVYPDDPSATKMARNLLGVASLGNDPRKQKRYVPVSDVLNKEAYADYKIVARRPSGPNPKGENKSQKTVAHYEVPIDLIELIEEKVPGSASWESAFFWDLIDFDKFLSLGVIQRAIADLLHTLKLVRPSAAERRRYIPPAIGERFGLRSIEEEKKRYFEALVPLTRLGCGHSVSLLAALCAESDLTGDYSLLDVHGRALSLAIDNFRSHELMQEMEVALIIPSNRIVSGYRGYFDLPPYSLLSAPLMSLEDWEKHTGDPSTPPIVD